MNVAVIGAGSWGTALAIQAARVGHRARLWDHNTERAEVMQAERQNARYLPGLDFPEAMTVTGHMEHALDDADVCIEAVPSTALRSILPELARALPRSAPVVCATKGIEVDTLYTMDEVLGQGLPPRQPLVMLGGPSFAREVASGMPTAVVVASRDAVANHAAAEALHGGFFRVYDTDDVVGVELGAALKNVMAIACGVSDGAGLGTNARAALITRGLAEISRVAMKRGANPLTMMGLAGLGDLVLTCTGDLSRNRRVGLGLGKGRSLREVLDELGQVAEGVVTARSAWQLAQREAVEMPITEQVYAMLYEDKPVGEVLRDLAGRGRRAERG
ncbi:MAG: NAD(P)-dependent glycerol-3-phosphate dehydrogenase [Deltaproteobacteria bacterium]|nr:NAD(P)-dependent glycerol-3-phosphate dehydrogenase [Deltaproteobacteria bacterium]